MDTKANTRLYDMARGVPDEAKKPITAGRLRGYTDVNPMYRIRRLTEMFGPCGIGWWYTIDDKRLVEDPNTHQWAAFVDISLYYVDPESGEVSHAIPGTGGASFVANEKNGPYMSDECYKMALTDSISVAAKAIGVAADVYFEKDRTKYSNGAVGSPPEAPQGQRPQGNQSGNKGSNQPSKKLANAQQKNLLRSIATPEQIEDCNKAYGENWERMPASHAAALIKKIQG